MSELLWLNDEQWTRLHPLLPTDVRGVPRVDDRRVISGIIHVLRSGGIAVDNQGQYAYWRSATGTTMYRTPVAALFDTATTSDALGNAVETVAQTFIADGYWMARSGTLYLTSCSDNSVRRMNPDKTFSVAAHDSRLLWPDSMAEGADGTIFVTASHIPQMHAWQGPGVAQTQLFSFKPA